MTTLPASILTLLQPFSKLFSTNKTWGHALLLIVGTLMCQGGRTVCSALKTLGMRGEKGFDKYHKILNRAQWSALQGSEILLRKLLVPEEETLVVAVDEHLERRRGKKIKAKGSYRDAVRSSKKCVVKCSGLKWITVMALKKLPWHSRLFALPFMTILAPSKAANEKRGKKHKTTIDWTIQLAKQLRRWLPNQRVIFSTDGGFANALLGWEIIRQKMHLISRLRQDARLFDFPASQSGPGRKAKKGQRLMAPRDMLKREDLDWKEEEVSWYGGKRKIVQYIAFNCLWHVEGHDPLPVKIVLLRDPEGKYESIALLGISHDFSLSIIEIIENYVTRWNQEVTHKEVREHLGVETQRQWSDKAIARTTPVLFGLYTLILLMAGSLDKISPLKPQQTAWYKKVGVTFSDAYREVRKLLWRNKLIDGFSENNDPEEILDSIFTSSLLDQLASTG